MSKGKKIYFVILLLSVLIVYLFYSSYAIFTYKREEHGKLNIVAGTLNYKLESKKLKNNQIEVDAGEIIQFSIKIISLNSIDSKYELYYILPEDTTNIEVGYSSYTIDNVKGIIQANENNDIKEVKVVIKNKSDNKAVITFGVHGGFSNLNFDDLKEKENGLNEIKVGDIILAWTYNGTKTAPTSFPKKGEGYIVESSECNGVDATFDNIEWQLKIPDTSEREVVCNLVFSDISNKLRDQILYTNKLVTSKPTLTTTSQNSNENGLYVSTATNSGDPTYYFRGAINNNWVDFAGFKWRIVRVNEDGTIRLILQGGIDSSAKYAYRSSASGVENMYYSGSNAESKLSAWYSTYIANNNNYSSKVVSGNYYCQQAKVKNASTYTSGNAEVPVYTDYTPNFRCEKDGNGKGIVSSNIGLLNYDEMVHTGSYPGVVNTNYFLYILNTWLMSPAGIDDSNYAMGYFADAGSARIVSNRTNYEIQLRAVINLDKDVTISEGNGTSGSHYVITGSSKLN